MNKTIKDLEKELDNLYNRDKELYYEFATINRDCNNHGCLNYGTMTHKGNLYHLCNDVYSGEHCPGWHPIYSETLDICFEYHNNK